jgi:RCC1 and BTB domain-containing protein
MFSENWDKNEIKEIEIDLYLYPVCYSFLKYIYTNSIEIEIENAMELYDLANSYLQNQLKHKCIKIVEKISTTNAFTLYSKAVYYNFQELENICLKFAAINVNNVCNTEAFKQMDPILYKRFLENASKLEAFK